MALLDFCVSFRDIAAIGGRPLDKRVLRELIAAPRVVQEAVIRESHHPGLHNIECPPCFDLGVAVGLFRNPSAWLQGNLTRMKRVYAADESLDADAVVRCVLCACGWRTLLFLASGSRDIAWLQGMERSSQGKKDAVDRYCRQVVPASRWLVV